MNQNGKNVRLLAEASRAGDMETARKILDETPDIVNVKFQGRFSPLANAMHFKKWEMSAFLLERGASAAQSLPPGVSGNDRVSKLETPEPLRTIFLENLPAADFCGERTISEQRTPQTNEDTDKQDDNRGIIEECQNELRHGIAPYKFNQEAHFLAKNGDAKKILQIIGNDVEKAKAKNAAEQTPAIVSALFGHGDLALSLIESFGGVDDFGLDGMTAIMHMAMQGKTEHVKKLLSKKPNISFTQSDGKDALLLACSNRHYDTAARILHATDNVDIAGKDGKTALMYAAADGNADFCDTILQFGANPKMKDKNGMTAFDHAKRNGHKEACSVISEHIPLSDVFKKHGIPENAREPIRRAPHGTKGEKAVAIADFAPLKEPSAIVEYVPKTQDVSEITVKVKKRRVA